MKHLLVVLAIAACAGKSDDCERLADKLNALPKDMLEKDTDRLVTACRKDVAKAGSDPTTRCILRADSHEEVVRCMAEGWRRESAAALRKAEAERDAGNAAVAAARRQLDKLQGELDAADARVARAVSDIANAGDRAEIEQAKRLGQLQIEQQALRKQMAEAREAAVSAGAIRPPHLDH